MVHVGRKSRSEYLVRFGANLENEHVAPTIADAVIYAAAGVSSPVVTFSPAAAEELATLARIAKSLTTIER